MSRFSAALGRLSGAVERRFGDKFLYQPAIKDGPTWKLDPDRAEQEIIAKFVEPDARAGGGTGISGYDRVSAGRMGEIPQHSNSRPRLIFAEKQLPYRPTKGDRVKCLETRTWYSVSEVRPHGGGRITLDLNG